MHDLEWKSIYFLIWKCQSHDRCLILFYSYTSEHSVSLSRWHKHKLLRFVACRIASAHKTNAGGERRREVSLHQGGEDEEHLLPGAALFIWMCCMIHHASPGVRCRSWRTCRTCVLHIFFLEICLKKKQRDNLMCTCWKFYFISVYLRHVRSVYSAVDSLCFIADLKRTFCACPP